MCSRDYRVVCHSNDGVDDRRVLSAPVHSIYPYRVYPRHPPAQVFHFARPSPFFETALTRPGAEAHEQNKQEQGAVDTGSIEKVGDREENRKVYR